jgi:hypothetical protein
VTTDIAQYRTLPCGSEDLADRRIGSAQANEQAWGEETSSAKSADLAGRALPSRNIGASSITKRTWCFTNQNTAQGFIAGSSELPPKCSCATAQPRGLRDLRTTPRCSGTSDRWYATSPYRSLQRPGSVRVVRGPLRALFFRLLYSKVIMATTAGEPPRWSTSCAAAAGLGVRLGERTKKSLRGGTRRR